MDEYLTTNEAGKKVHLTPHYIAYQAHHKQIDAYKTSERKWLVKVVTLNNGKSELVKAVAPSERGETQVAAKPPLKENAQDTRLREHFDQIATTANRLASRVEKLLYYKNCGATAFRGDIVKGLRSYWGSPDDASVVEIEGYFARCVFVHYEHRFGELPYDHWEDVTKENATQEVADNLVRLANSKAFNTCPKCPVCIELAGIEPVSPDSIPVVDGKTGKVWYMQPMPPDF